MERPSYYGLRIMTPMSSFGWSAVSQAGKRGVVIPGNGAAAAAAGRDLAIGAFRANRVPVGISYQLELDSDLPLSGRPTTAPTEHAWVQCWCMCWLHQACLMQ